MADITVTPANVFKGPNSQALDGIAGTGVTIAAGKPVYQLGNGTYGLSDSNGTTPMNSVAGMALNGCGPGQPFKFVAADPKFVSGATLTSGDVIYLSDTPGSMTNAYADIATGSTVIVLGVVNTDGTLNFNPAVGGTK